MQVLIASSSTETGTLLTQMLTEVGVRDDVNATVCYGLSGSNRYILNAACKLDKIERMRIMAAEGVRTIPWFRAESSPPPLGSFSFPLLARKKYGHGGTDIIPVFQPEELAWRRAAGYDWFSQYIPVAQEYRVWIYRSSHLDTYEKVMNRPAEYKHIGRNFRNGFDFQLGEVQDDAYLEAYKAVKALKLDFGAVDLIRGTNGLIYILEVNTAPGVLKSGAEATLRKLAGEILMWQQAGYPERDL